MRFHHFGRLDETEDENDGWPKVSDNQTNHVVATGINRSLMVTQYHLLRNGCQKFQRHNENHGSRRIKHLFLVSPKITPHGCYGNQDSRGKK